MTFDEALDQVRALLQQRGRVTYRSLKLRYQLDDELLAGVTDELISAERVAVDEDGKVLVWTGGAAQGEAAKRGNGEQEVVRSQLSVVSPQPPHRHDVLGDAAERRMKVGRSFKAGLQVRIGIHSGPVVIGEMGGGRRAEQLALGETPNITARLQGVAVPDTVVISAATQRLVQGFFECQDLGSQTLKGISVPQTVYQIMAENATPLMGRESELGVLGQRWEQAKSGAGQVVLLSGEPGIGKSRLVQELEEHVSAQGATCIEFRCSPYHRNTALYPIIEHLQRLLEFQSGDNPEEKLQKLEVGARRTVPLQPEAIPLLTIT